MDKIYYITLLYDFYGELLTEKQKAVITQHFLNDLSLNEVAIEHNITRQAVLDMIRRTEKLLLQYEDKLQLVKKYLVRKEKVSDVLKRLDALGNDEKIEDILAGRTVTGKSGFGLYSLIKRIHLTYGIENPVIIQSEVGVGTEIIVTIKKIKMEK